MIHRPNPLLLSSRSVLRLLAVFLLLPLAGCGLMPEEEEPFSDPLLAPLLQAPVDGHLYPYLPASGPPSVELVWRHGMPTARVPNPHQAERIIICVYDQQRGRCESGTREGVPKPIWFEAAVDDPAINRAPITPEQLPFLPSPDIHLGYEFRASLRMRSEYRDRTLAWQVGACLSGTCRMSTPRSLRIKSLPR